MNDHYPFKLSKLPYEDNELSPYIDPETVQIHHTKHLGKYIDTLNSILREYPMYQGWSLDRLILQNCLLPYKIQKDVFNNAGGIYNHDFYFSMLCPPSENNIPQGKLLRAINKCFGSYEEFKKQIVTAATEVFGSGYAWLICEASGRLKIAKTFNGLSESVAFTILKDAL